MLFRSLTEYRGIAAEKLDFKRTIWRHLRLAMLDEVSMVGRKFFDFINGRFQELMNSNKIFGGLHIILSGDLFQLRPIEDYWVFADRPDSLQNVWKEFFKYYELTKIMRQQHDAPFAAALNIVREAIPGPDLDAALGLLATRTTT